MVRVKVSDGFSTWSLWIETDSGLSLETLQSMFPGSTNLINPFYEDGGAPLSVCNNKIFNPDDWDVSVIYLVYFPPSPSTSMSCKSKFRLIDSTIPPKKEKISNKLFTTSTDLNKKQKEDVECLRKFMFYSILVETETGTFKNISTIRSCVTIAKKEIALMAAHCLPDGVPEQFQFEIFNQKKQPHLVEVKYINRQFDFVVLKTVNKEFDVCPIGLAYPDVGTKYAILGYHGYNNQPSKYLSAFFGRIRNNQHFEDLSFIVGSPGTTRGCSGAGAFTLLSLVGIVVSGRVLPQNVYSKTKSLADHVAEACIELAEPSYSHIVPSSTIFALFNMYTGRPINTF